MPQIIKFFSQKKEETRMEKKRKEKNRQPG